MIPRQTRQGDLLLDPIEAIPTDAEPVENRVPLVLAAGEATGHTHRIEKTERLKTYRLKGKLYLEVGERVEILHQTHAPLALVPGAYVVRRQVEQWLDEVRPVAD